MRGPAVRRVRALAEYVTYLTGSPGPVSSPQLRWTERGRGGMYVTVMHGDVDTTMMVEDGQ